VELIDQGCGSKLDNSLEIPSVVAPLCMPLASASMMTPMSVMPNPMLVRIQILEVSVSSSSPRPNEVLPLFFLQLKRVAIQVLISFFLGESY
jgi:hypothetical protein